MTQQPFSRPGAIDLSALKRPATPPPPSGAPAGAGGGHGGRAGAGSYSLTITEENFQSTVEASMTAPVLLVFYSRARMPESGQLADDLAALSGEFEGRFLVGLVDIDATPSIAQAMQIQAIPLVVAVVDGRPMPLFQDVVPVDELRAALTQVGQQLTTQGITGRHQPRSGARAPDGAAARTSRRSTRGTPPPRTRSVTATSSGRSRSTRSSSTPTPPTPRPRPGWPWPGCCSARRASTSTRPARTPTARPDDLDAQTLVADLDMLGGQVDGGLRPAGRPGAAYVR